MLKISAIIGGIVLCLMVLVAYIAGVFDSVTFTHTEVGPYNLVYREHRGQYTGIRFLMNDVFRYVLSSQKKVRIQYGFAIFYDDPSKVPQDSLRSITGVITDSLMETKKPYKSATFERTDALITEFPIRSALSYTTGYFKYYDALQKIVQKDSLVIAGPILEIYDSPNKKIFYVAPLDTALRAAPQFGK